MNHLIEGIEKQMEDMTKKFANAILSRRKQLGLTQEQLAEKIGTTKQVVSKYENAQRSPKVIMANAFASALDTTLDELLGVEPTNIDDDRLEALHQNPKLCQLFDRQRRMSEEDIDKMLQLSDWIVKENYGE